MSLLGVILVRIFPAFSYIRTEYGEIRISPYSVQMQGNDRKMQTRITTNTGTFHAVVTTTRISKMRQHFHKIFCLIQICQLFNSFTFSMITVLPLLTFSRRRSLSHRNQSIPLESKVSKSKVFIPDSCQGSIQNSAEAFVQRCFVKKVFLEISQNSQENTGAKDSI